MVSPNLRMARVVALLLVLPGCGGGSSSKGNDRWVTTQDTTVEIDWDAVGEAYKTAEGPEDFEQKVNEIYTGDEIISVSVYDKDKTTQEVAGFFDKDQDGKVSESEKVFTIQRDIVDPEKAEYQVQGHNAYSSYHSPIYPLLAGVATGYMVSRIFSPSYAPAYTQAYVTPTSRRGELATSRDAYRQKNPEKFKSTQKSKTGKTYGKKGGAYGGGRSAPAPSRPRSTPSRGGGRFGIKRKPTRSIRLEA